MTRLRDRTISTTRTPSGAIAVSSPYSVRYIEQAKAYGARWEPKAKVWVWPADKVHELQIILEECYSSPHITVAPEHAPTSPHPSAPVSPPLSLSPVRPCVRCGGVPDSASTIATIPLCAPCGSAVVMALASELRKITGARAPSLHYPVCRFCGKNAPTLGTPAAVVGMCLDCEKFGHGPLARCADPECTCQPGAYDAPTIEQAPSQTAALTSVDQTSREQRVKARMQRMAESR